MQPLRILLAICIAFTPETLFAQGLGDTITNALTGFAAGGGNHYAQEQQASAAAADGMQLLVRLWEQNGHDRQKAWIAFFQSREGQRVTRTPGALKLLTDWFNSVMALPSGPQGASYPTAPQSLSRPQQPPESSSTKPTDQAGGSVQGNLTAPFLGPYRPNAYGPGINSDATGRAFVWKPDQGPADPLAQVRPDVFGPGIGMDQYGRPVRAACPPYQQNC